MDRLKPKHLIASIFIVACACGESLQSPPGRATLTGQLEGAGLLGVQGLEAVSLEETLHAPLDDQGAFVLELQPKVPYTIWLSGTQRSPVEVERAGTLDLLKIMLIEDQTLDLGRIRLIDDRVVATPEETPPEPPACMVDLSECEFTTYNLDVQVGDRFVLTNFLSGCVGQAGIDFFFEYEDDETWNLEVFNSNGVVEIVEADLEGGNKSEGEYRFRMIDAQGEELDHATIRIDHGDSDVEVGDDIAKNPFAEQACLPDDSSGNPSCPSGLPDCL